MRNITGSEAVWLLQRTVDKAAEKGDTKRECRYLDDGGEPHCIVGCILVNELGVNVDTVLSIEGLNFHEAVEDKRLPGLTFDRQAMQILVAAQEVQDTSGTWGQALESAASKYAELDLDPTKPGPFPEDYDGDK